MEIKILRKIGPFGLLAAIWIFWGGLYNNAFAIIPAIERAALVSLYQSTDGDNWFINTGWKEPPLDSDGFSMPGTECNWYGLNLSCGATSVRFISLRNNNLSGNIPPEIGNLSELVYLRIDGNKLVRVWKAHWSGLSQELAAGNVGRSLKRG